MKVGTKSILFGVHQFLIHPWIVALAWHKLYGFPFDPRLWVAFFVHDLGYWGSPNMDGVEGERHVEFGANLMRCLFGEWWGDFCLYHSRFYARRDEQHFSDLCVADKLAFCLEPWWFYLPRAWASSELQEYMSRSAEREGGKYVTMNLDTRTARSWFTSMTTYLRGWVEEHKDGRDDTWTPATSNERSKKDDSD